MPFGSSESGIGIPRTVPTENRYTAHVTRNAATAAMTSDRSARFQGQPTDTLNVGAPAESNRAATECPRVAHSHVPNSRRAVTPRYGTAENLLASASAAAAPSAAPCRTLGTSSHRTPAYTLAANIASIGPSVVATP